MKLKNLERFDISKIMADRVKARWEEKRILKERELEMKEEIREAYLEGWYEGKINEAKRKGIEDANKKPLDRLKKIKKMILPPYSPGQLEMLAGKPIIVRENENFYNTYGNNKKKDVDEGESKNDK
jgi:hypothetical protein